MINDPAYMRSVIERWHKIDAENDARIASLSAQRDIAFGVALALLAIAALLAMGWVM